MPLRLRPEMEINRGTQPWIEGDTVKGIDAPRDVGYISGHVATTSESHSAAASWWLVKAQVHGREVPCWRVNLESAVRNTDEAPHVDHGSILRARGHL